MSSQGGAPATAGGREQVAAADRYCNLKKAVRDNDLEPVQMDLAVREEWFPDAEALKTFQNIFWRSTDRLWL
eukprot:11174367-Lingulodinium_polyedra.AAC.1